MLMGLLGVPGLASTIDRMSYGEPITNIGKANVPLLPPATADALMLVSGLMSPASRGALKASDAAVRAITGNPEATAVRVLNYAADMPKMLSASSWRGPLNRNDMGHEWLDGLISSQRYLDRDVVARKIRLGDFDVKVSPQFEIDGLKVRAIQDGHHSLEAAIRSGNKPRFTEQTPTMNDRVSLLDSGNIDQFLEASWIDSPWYSYKTKRDLF